MNPQDPKDSKLDELGLPKPIEPFSSQEVSEPALQPSKEQLSQAMAPALEQTEKFLIQVENIEARQSTPEVKAEEIVPVQETQPVATTQATQPQAQEIEKDPLVKEIEQVLSEDLEKEFLLLTPKLQDKFRREGETLALKIRKLLMKSKINFKKIASLIMKWLKIIPHVNKYFLMQESKIKADKIANLKNKSSIQ